MNTESIPKDNIKMLSSISRLVSELSNRQSVPNLPYVGEYAFAHKGGVHVSAVKKKTISYEHIQPEQVRNKRKILISELSGKSNVQEKLKEFGIRIKKSSPAIRNALDRIKGLEADGYYFEGAEASFELLYKLSMHKIKEYFTLQGLRILVLKNSDNNSAWAEAIIKVKIPEKIARARGYSETVEQTSTDGRGPVEVLDKSLRKVLEKFYPEIKKIKLTDYKVRILNEQAGTKATTRVLINFTDGKMKWSTVGVSDNILEASWIALSDAFRYKLMRNDEMKDKKRR